MQLREKKRKKLTLNIISLIDVVFLLLIFFMLISKYVEQKGMKLDLPSTKSFDTTKSQEILLQIDSNGKMLMNDNEISMEDLASKIIEILPEVTEKTLIIKADKELAHGNVVKIMDIARSNGLKKIVIATDLE
ncbi:MAG: biopolymer transporter ExbD [Candidatus Cloacimonetes bacterium]|nr:biopolymer transporter ExbD [Candidatus Cloacimonadota bacterium]